jgi:hypothetical protein
MGVVGVVAGIAAVAAVAARDLADFEARVTIPSAGSTFLGSADRIQSVPSREEVSDIVEGFAVQAAGNPASNGAATRVVIIRVA